MWTIIFTIKDAKGKTSKVEIHLPGAVLLAAVEAFMNSFVLLLDAVIGGMITGMSATRNFTVPGAAKQAPQAASDVEEGALFIFNTVGGHQTRFRVPTFLETKVASDSRLVNQADAAVAPLINAMIAGLAGTLPSDARDEDITSISSAKELFQKSRR